MAWKWDARTNRYVFSNDGGMGGDVIADMMAPPTTAAAPATTTPARRGPTSQTPSRGTTPRPTTTTAAPTSTAAPRTPTTTVAPSAAKPKAKTVKPSGNIPDFTNAAWRRGQQLGEEVTTAISGALNQPGTDLTGLINTLLSTAGDGSGGSGWKPNPAAAAAAFQAAAQQEAAGRGAQKQYQDLAASILAQTMGNIGTRYGQTESDINNWYNQQQTAAQQAINAANQQFLSSLPQATAYANPQLTAMTPEAQALGQMLGAYGATGAEAATVAQQDAQMNQAIANIMRQSAQQVGQAETGYMDALRRAGQGGQAAALTALAQNVLAGRTGELAGVRSQRAQEESQAQGAQQELLLAGIQALLQGQQMGAETRAKATAEYGRPPKKSKKPKSGKKK